MSAKEVAEMLIEDHEGFRREFAADEPYRSFLQRRDADLDEMLKKFDWTQDDREWIEMYDKKGDKNGDDTEKMIRLRRRMSFLICGWRDVKEDFGRGDVSCLRDIRVPLATSWSPLRCMRDEFNGDGR